MLFGIQLEKCYYIMPSGGRLPKNENLRINFRYSIITYTSGHNRATTITLCGSLRLIILLDFGFYVLLK